MHSDLTLFLQSLFIWQGSKKQMIKFLFFEGRWTCGHAVRPQRPSVHAIRGECSATGAQTKASFSRGWPIWILQVKLGMGRKKTSRFPFNVFPRRTYLKADPTAWLEHVQHTLNDRTAYCSHQALLGIFRGKQLPSIDFNCFLWCLQRQQSDLQDIIQILPNMVVKFL